MEEGNRLDHGRKKNVGKEGRKEVKRMVQRKKGERKERSQGKVNRLGQGRKKKKRCRERREGAKKKERKQREQIGSRKEEGKEMMVEEGRKEGKKDHSKQEDNRHILNQCNNKHATSYR